MIEYLLIGIYAFLFLLSHQEKLRKTEMGKKIFLGIEENTFRFLSSRAEANNKEELHALEKIFIIPCAASLILSFSFSTLEFTILAKSCFVIFLFTALGSISLEWSLSHKKALKDYLKPSTSLPILSGIVLGSIYMNYFLQINSNLPEWSIYLIIFFSLISFGAIVYLFSWLFFGSITAIIFIPLYLSSKFSDIVLKNLNRNHINSLIIITTLIITVIIQLY